MHWIIQSNFYRKSEPSWQHYEDFIQCLKVAGVKHTVVDVAPFGLELTPKPIVEPGELCVVFGSISMSEVAAKHNWTPGICNEGGQFDQRVWGKAYWKLALNHDAAFLEFNAIPEFQDMVFLRPVHDYKSFTGSLVDWPWVKQQQEHLKAVSVKYREDRRTLCADTPMVIASPKKLLREYRFFIVGKKVLAGSQYRLAGEKVTRRCLQKTADPMDTTAYLHDETAMMTAETAAEAYRPAPAYSLDIAVIDTGVKTSFPICKIIEINCINHSGFYAADMLPMVMELEKIYAA